MQNEWIELGFFLLKTGAILILIVLSLGLLAALFKGPAKAVGQGLEIENLTDLLLQRRMELEKKTLERAAFKKIRKRFKEQQKKLSSLEGRLFVIDFAGDIRASQAKELSMLINSVLKVATDKDEVLVRLESPGGMVAGYGLAASQLARLKQAGIRLVVAVDKMAASGGYLMAAMADEILAAPFAIIGSIGVVAQLPNFNRLLKDRGVDFEQITAGQYKRTLTLFGENTDEKRQKMQEDINGVHQLFKDSLSASREGLDMDKVATGEHWFGTQAKELNLIDRLATSDDYLLEKLDQKRLFRIAGQEKKSLWRRLSPFGAEPEAGL